MNLLAQINSRIWAMLPSELDKLRMAAVESQPQFEKLIADPQMLEQIQNPSAIATRNGERMAGTRYVRMRGDIAVIGIQGAMFTSGGIYEEIVAYIFGGTSTKTLAKDIQAAIDSPSVKGIVLDIHSPGGEAFGINELSQLIYQARRKKMIRSYISGLGASASLFAAVGAEKVIADKMALIGSIGVVSGWADFTGFYEKFGIAYEEVTSSNAPYKRLDIRKPDERAVFQAELDGMEKVFIDFVAKARGVKRETVISDFGKGAVMPGHEAVKVGMIDATGSLEETIAEMRSSIRKAAKSSFGAENTEGEFDMGFKEKFKAFAAEFGFEVKEQTAPEAEAENAETETAAEAQNTILAEKEAAEKNAQAANDELARIKAEQEDARKKQISADADAFVEGEIKAGRMFPSEKETFKSLFVQAATDDNASPLAEGSRLAALKTNQSKRKAHTLTEEVIDAEANQIVLAAAGGDEKEVSADRQKELLEKTPLGKSALKVVKGGGA